MALTHHFCLGPAANDAAIYNFGAGVTLERTGVSAGDAGWAKYSDTAAREYPNAFYMVDELDVAVPTSGKFVWDAFYWYGPDSLSVSGYKGVWSAVGTTHFCRLRFINDAGIYRFELLEDTTSKGMSGSYPGGVTRIIVIRVDQAASIVYVYIDGNLEITATITGSVHTDTDYPKQLWVPASSEAAVGYWSSWMRVSDSSDTLDETQYPECHGHGAVGNGNYTGFSGAFGDWDDLNSPPDGMNDGQATIVWLGQATGKETSTIGSKTYANTVLGATMLFYLRQAIGGSKNIPWSTLMRYSGSDKEITMPTPTGTTYFNFNAGYSAMPGGADWSNLSGATTVEIGVDRTAAGDNTNLEITSIWLEGAALGTTNKSPAAPPASSGQPMLHRRRQGSDWPAAGVRTIGRGR